MLYYLFTYLREHFSLFGAGVFYYITFRAGMAIILSLIITTVFGKAMINYLQRKQIGETVRDLGLAGEQSKRGTPTMGGLIIIAGILVPTLLFARVLNVYVLLMIVSTVWLGLVGFLDDYIKVFKKNKEGLAGRFKILGQIGLGLIIGLTMYYNDNVVVTRQVVPGEGILENPTEEVISEPYTRKDETGSNVKYVAIKSQTTTIPFVRSHEMSYAHIAAWISEGSVKTLTPVIYILFVIFIIVAVSNGANITDGIDGLATGTSAIIGICLGVFS